MKQGMVTDINDSPLSAILKVGKGNPGALRVLLNINDKMPHGLAFIIKLDEMGIRGSDIWLGFKDYCKQDLHKFYTLVMEGDEGMQEFINSYGL